MLEKVKEIVADSLGADVSTLTAESSFLRKIWEQIPLTYLRWLWLLRKNLEERFRQRI